MDKVLQGLRPEKVFYYFEEISRIPRGSGNEKQISDYLYNLAKSKGWEVIQDHALNIIIKKPATKGYENAPAVMIQGHMDMVCEKNEGIDHDFKKDPIKLRVVDNFIYATETTLGADNGIAVAYALSILDSDDFLAHPPLEILITTDEEVGMTGAEKVDGSLFKSKYLLNLDSEAEGVFVSGCAGGCEVVFQMPLIYQNAEKDERDGYKITVKGLQGGHSGVDVKKERGNANKIIGRVLYDLIDDTDLISINGGSKTNAVPREASAVVTLYDIETVQEKIESWNNILKNEFSFTDPSVDISIEKLNIKARPIEKTLYKKILTAINNIPSGVLSSSTVIDLTISSNNLGVIKTENNMIYLYNNARSSVESLLTHGFALSMKQLADALSFQCEIGGFYPGWEYAKHSPLRDICLATYKEIFNKEAKVEAIHAGLECGLLMGKIKGLDAISLGPDTWDVHSPNEHISIKSIENIYNLICEILKRIK